MGLDRLLRDAVALAATITRDLQVDVVHTPFASRSKTGVVSYGSPTTRPGIVDRKRRKVENGLISQGTIIFLADVPLSLDDRLTLPDGAVVTVIGVNSVVDPAGGGYATEVFMGPSPPSAV